MGLKVTFYQQVSSMRFRWTNDSLTVAVIQAVTLKRPISMLLDCQQISAMQSKAWLVMISSSRVRIEDSKKAEKCFCTLQKTG